ncbi:hypothetical protein DFH08DRAFT_896816 [Mycena albidolilacea]|uniref:DUF3494 domain-containing protein n=1 Tax=Mycena albidolilacea TaxID=1033008 RepID=A0AAD6Z9R1_9AGAR|nr:hypothetical protein DFH08DRAFT_896816 [Mycena albidolilacea]
MGTTDALPTPGLPCKRRTLTRQVILAPSLPFQRIFIVPLDRPLPNFLELKAGLIGGSILVPGLYKWTTGVTITTGITLAGGPADSSWIFQISGGLVQASAAVVGTVSVGANAQLAGNILAQTNVVIGTNAIDNGCIYAQTDVALEKATVLCSGGAVPPVSSSAGSSASTPSGGSSSSPSGGSSSAPVSSSSAPVSSSSAPVSSTFLPTSSSSPTQRPSKTFSHPTTTSTYRYYGY